MRFSTLQSHKNTSRADQGARNQKPSQMCLKKKWKLYPDSLRFFRSFAIISLSRKNSDFRDEIFGRRRRHRSRAQRSFSVKNRGSIKLIQSYTRHSPHSPRISEREEASRGADAAALASPYRETRETKKRRRRDSRSCEKRRIRKGAHVGTSQRRRRRPRGCGRGGVRGLSKRNTEHEYM